MSERSIWAKVILNIKQTGDADLHSIVVNIATVTISEGTFYIFSNDSQIVQQLNQDTTYQKLVASFVTIGYNYNIVVMYRPSASDIEMQKINALSTVLGCKITIKD